MFVALAEFPDYFIPRMKSFIAIAPALHVMKKKPSPSTGKKGGLPPASQLKQIVSMVGPELMTMKQAYMIHKMKKRTPEQIVKSQLDYTRKMMDSDTDLINMEAFRTSMNFTPAGSSYMQFVHFMQIASVEEFRKFDYGSAEKNRVKYGQDKPPTYNLENIKGVNIALVCGKTDTLTDKPEYDWAHSYLKKRNNVEFLEFPEGHFGLMIPKNIGTTDRIVKQILSYEATAKL